MRNSALLRYLFLILALTSPALLRAQFQDPTPEELKMTSDPKAPGAAAVYLNVEEIANDDKNYQSVYVRIKVLTEKGKELATVDVPPYLRGQSKITEIKARTIHSDGTIIPFAGKPQDLLVVKSTTNRGEQFQVNRKVFTLPSVEVGSILEYTYTIQNDDNSFSAPQWEIQRPYFVHKAHYTFTPFKAFRPGRQNETSRYLEDEHERPLNSLVWTSKLPDGVTVKRDADGRFSVDVTDIPPAPDEEWMPPINSLIYRVSFYYKTLGDANYFWVEDARLWSKDVDHFAEPTKPIREAVAGLIAPTDSDLDKAKKLYKVVQALDNTDYSRRKTESEMTQLRLRVAKRAEDTWAQKSGSSEDIALLYLAMLRAAGLTANAMKVVDREQGIFDSTYLSFSQFDNTIVLLNIGGKEIGLDPGEKMAPFGTINWRHSNAGGIRQLGDKRGVTTSPPQAYPGNKTTRMGDLTLDDHGAITGQLSFTMTGQEALRWRQSALRNDPEELKKQFDHSLESILPDGVEAHIDHFLGLENPDADLMAIINVRGNLGAATSKRLLLPAYFFETRGAHPFVAQENRLEQVDMHYGELVTDQITYHLPSGMTIEGAPQDARISWPDHAVLVTKSASAPNQITIARTMARAFTFAKPEEYQDLRAFYQKIAAADQQQLVLTAAQVAKGN